MTLDARVSEGGTFFGLGRFERCHSAMLHVQLFLKITVNAGAKFECQLEFDLTDPLGLSLKKYRMVFFSSAIAQFCLEPSDFLRSFF